MVLLTVSYFKREDDDAVLWVLIIAVRDEGDDDGPCQVTMSDGDDGGADSKMVKERCCIKDSDEGDDCARCCKTWWSWQIMTVRDDGVRLNFNSQWAMQPVRDEVDDGGHFRNFKWWWYGNLGLMVAMVSDAAGRLRLIMSDGDAVTIKEMMMS